MNKKRSIPGAGLSTILLVFVVLCLVVFAVLSLTTARADLQMSRKTAKRTSQYYAAQSSASRRIKQIDEILTTQYNNNRTEFLASAAAELEKEQELTITKKSAEQGEPEAVVCRFQQPVNDDQQLQVELVICEPKEEGGDYYQISSWQVIQTNDWQPDTALPVFKKEA